MVFILWDSKAQRVLFCLLCGAGIGFPTQVICQDYDRDGMQSWTHKTQYILGLLAFLFLLFVWLVIVQFCNDSYFQFSSCELNLNATLWSLCVCVWIINSARLSEAVWTLVVGLVGDGFSCQSPAVSVLVMCVVAGLMYAWGPAGQGLEGCPPSCPDRLPYI